MESTRLNKRRKRATIDFFSERKHDDPATQAIVIERGGVTDHFTWRVDIGLVPAT